MIIENVEALRSWLTDKLRPICDADPSALAKYVVALIKKEKPLNELEDVCADQLDVFLADETNKFVEDLFNVLESKAYLPNNQLMIQSTANATQSKSSQENVLQEDIAKTEDSPITVAIEESNKETSSQVEEVDEKQMTVNPDSTEKKESNIADEFSKKRRGSNRNHDSFAARGHTRSHRYVRKEKDFDTIVDEFLNAKKPRNDLEGNGARGRSMSPGSRRSPRRQSPGGRRYRSRRDRRRRSEERRNSRKKQRCRDYEEKGVCLLGNSCLFDHGKDPVVNLLGIQGLAAPPLPMIQPPQSVPQIPELFGGVFPSSMIANPVASLPANTLTLDTGLTLVSGQQRPLPSVAELQHGIPVFNQPQPALRTIQPMEAEKREQRKDAAEKITTEASKSQSGSEAYNPEEPSIDFIEQPVKQAPSWIKSSNKPVGSGQGRVYNAYGQFPPTTMTAEQFLQKMCTPSSAILSSHISQAAIPNAISSVLQRNLMALPTVPPLPGIKASSIVQGQAFAAPAPAAVTNLQTIPTKPPVTSPPRRPFMNQTILEIRKIPLESNTVVKLSEYFQKFGSIVNIQVNYEGDPQAALIQFSSNSEARRAYSSPEAVLGNRFIKLFWHNKTKELPPMASQPHVVTTQNSAKTSNMSGEAGVKPPTEVSKPKLPSSGQTTYVNPESTPEALLKKQAEMKRENMKKKLEIQKQRRLLLEKQIKEQKALINKLEKNKNMSASEKQLLMSALKTLTSSIEKLKTDLEAQAKASKPMSKQALEKELLDREIELYNKQMVGEDFASIKVAGTDLQKETGHQQNARPVGRGRGRGRGRGMSRGRGFADSRGSQHTSKAVVDNRPKQVLVAGYEEKDKDAVVAQFAIHGEIDRVEEKPGGKLVLSFKTRKQAEIAATRAAVFNGKPLILAWYNAVQHTKRSSSSTSSDYQPAKLPKREIRRSSVSSLLEEDKDDADLLADFDDKEADLLLLEEDEDEDEERSWKR